MTRKQTAIATMQGEPTNVMPFMPITMMYAADQIGVPYREYATTAATMARAQLKIADEFRTSHVATLSDPAVEAYDLGAKVGFPEDAPPYIIEDQALLLDKSRLVSLTRVRPEEGRRMSNRIEAVRLLAEEVGDELLVEGWVEGPCAEAADLRGINRLMMDFYDDPDFVADLMDFITNQAIEFAIAQIRQGANIVGIGDAASSLIGPVLYAEFCVARTKRCIDAIHEAGGLVRLHICGTTQALAESWNDLGADLIDIDYGNSMATVRRVLGDEGATLAGNLDPVREVRDGTPQSITALLRDRCNESAPKYIVGAGCEIPRQTPAENLKAMWAFAERRS